MSVFSAVSRTDPIELGLRANLWQFTLLVVVNAFVGAMVGLERSILRRWLCWRPTSTHPGWSRLYARVITPSVIRQGEMAVLREHGTCEPEDQEAS